MNTKYLFVMCTFAVVAACAGSSTGDTDDGDAGKGGGGLAGRNAGNAGSTNSAGGSASGGKAGSTTPGAGGSAGNLGGQAGSTAGAAGGSNASGFPTASLIGYWPFDEGTGTQVNDKSGQQNNGTLVEGTLVDSPVLAAPVWTAGKKGKAVTLDGTDDWIKIARSDSLDTTGSNGSVTVAAWVNMQEYGQATQGLGYNFVVCRQEVGTPHEHFGLGMLGGKPTAAVHFFFATAAEVIALNEWSHIAMSYDGITLTIYTNGVPGASMDIGWPIAADTTPLTIGGAQNVDTIKEYIRGSIDEVYLFNASLSGEEIKAVMAAGQ